MGVRRLKRCPFCLRRPFVAAGKHAAWFQVRCDCGVSGICVVATNGWPAQCELSDLGDQAKRGWPIEAANARCCEDIARYRWNQRDGLYEHQPERPRQYGPKGWAGKATYRPRNTTPTPESPAV